MFVSRAVSIRQKTLWLLKGVRCIPLGPLFAEVKTNLVPRVSSTKAFPRAAAESALWGWLEQVQLALVSLFHRDAKHNLSCYCKSRSKKNHFGVLESRHYLIAPLDAQGITIPRVQAELFKLQGLYTIKPYIFIGFPRNNSLVLTISWNSLKYVNIPEYSRLFLLVVFRGLPVVWLSMANSGMHTKLSHLHVQGHMHTMSSSPDLFRGILQAWVTIYTHKVSKLPSISLNTVKVWLICS